MNEPKWIVGEGQLPTSTYIRADGGATPTQREMVLAEMIVSYYNGTDIKHSDLPGVKFWSRAGIDFRGLEGLVCLMQAEFGTFDLPDRLFASHESAAAELGRQLPDFRAAIEWLCSREVPEAVKSIPIEDVGVLALPETQTMSDDMRQSLRLAIQECRQIYAASRTPVTGMDLQCLQFLEDHGRKHIKKELQLWGGRIVKVTAWSHPKHLIDLFCSFLLDKCVGQDPDTLPVKLCPQCRKLFVTRPKKDYCSADCRSKKFWTKEKRADDMYVRRLENYDNADLRAKLGQPDVRDRLELIELSWPAESAIIGLIGRIRHRANGGAKPHETAR